MPRQSSTDFFQNLNKFADFVLRIAQKCIWLLYSGCWGSYSALPSFLAVIMGGDGRKRRGRKGLGIIGGGEGEGRKGRGGVERKAKGERRGREEWTWLPRRSRFHSYAMHLFDYSRKLLECSLLNFSFNPLQSPGPIVSTVRLTGKNKLLHNLRKRKHDRVGLLCHVYVFWDCARVYSRYLFITNVKIIARRLPHFNHGFYTADE